MTVFSLLIFDRHTTCCYFHHFAGKLPPPGPSTLPNVYPTTALPAPHESSNSSRQDTMNTQTRRPPPWEQTVLSDTPTVTEPARASDELPFDEEAKLVYGVIFSLRNMAKKLSHNRDGESFHSYSTSAYKLHYLHTPTSYHFVLLSSPMQDTLRPLLRQIYMGPFLDWVVRNPLVELDSNLGAGIDNEAFRAAIEKIVAPA